MFYYLLDKNNPEHIRDASKNKNELIALLEWIPGYTVKDIKSTKEELINAPEGWVKAKEYIAKEEEEEAAASAILDAQMSAQNQEVLDRVEEVNQYTTETYMMINDLKDELDGLKQQVYAAVDPSLDAKSMYDDMNPEELRTCYIEKMSQLIKDACSDIIYEYYPVYKQLNISMLSDDDQEKKDFIAYRDYMTAQCHVFIEDLKSKELSDTEMRSILVTYLYEPHVHSHKQGVLSELGFPYVYKYDPEEILKKGK